ncbi:hypothetical protein [Paenibacillus sambharensis]|nr:hypothetical protein [Paenibacillus sambharensis]
MKKHTTEVQPARQMRLDWELAMRLAPRLYMDELEPFKPVMVGVTLIDRTFPSPSFRRTLNVDQESMLGVIEYAVYYDYDIQHLYDLEHVWVYVAHDGSVLNVEASFHGKYLRGLLPDRSNLGTDGRASLFVQPGKHAFSPMPEFFLLLPDVESANDKLAGSGGVLEPDMLKGAYKTVPGEMDLKAEAHLQEFRFKPSFQYVPYEWPEGIFVTWDVLKEEIPKRMRLLLESI